MITLEDKYSELCNKERTFDPDLHPTLVKYATECSHITEVGVRWVESTFSFLMGKPETLVLIDIDHPSIHVNFDGEENFKLAIELAKQQNTKMTFTQASILDIDIEDTDLLFIDTEHSYLQLKHELLKHSNKAKKYIIMHDTLAHAHVDSSAYSQQHTLTEIDKGDFEKHGLLLAISEFLEKNKNWELFEQTTTGQGLTVLKRIK